MKLHCGMDFLFFLGHSLKQSNAASQNIVTKSKNANKHKIASCDLAIKEDALHF